MKRLAVLLCILPACLLLDCGGSASSCACPEGLPAAVQIEGALTGQAGALQLDGRTLDLGQAQINVDGQPATADDLQPGMVVDATATLGAASAQVSALRATTLLQGPITAVDVARLRFTVLGRTVQVDSGTILVQRGEGRTWTTLAFGDLKVGDIVAVCGFAQADGSVAASRIERLPAGAPSAAVVAGLVSSLDAVAKTFFLDATKVDYGTATIEGTLANGAKAMAAGSFVGAVFKAVRVVVMPAPPPNAPRILVGPVSDLNAAAHTFHVGSTLVDYATATVVGTLANGVLVAVEGTPGSTGLKATKVTVLGTPPPSPAPWNGMAAAPVTALDATGSLKVGTSAFWMDAHTVVIGMGPSMMMGTPVQLKVGDWVTVGFDSNRLNAQGAPYAAKILVLPTNAPRLPLIGPISAFRGGSRTFTLQGFTVQVAATTRYAVSGREVDAAAFWSTDRSGSQAEAMGTPQGSTFNAQVIQVR